jgi:hypothetical protein
MHHVMGRCRVADGDGIHIQKIAADTLNKQSRTANKGWYSALGVVGLGANNFSRKKKYFYEIKAERLTASQEWFTTVELSMET